MKTTNKALEENDIQLILLEDICEDLLGYTYERAKYLAAAGMIDIPVFKLQLNAPKAPWFVHIGDLRRAIKNKRLAVKSDCFDC
jgi:hypothetical protein